MKATLRICLLTGAIAARAAGLELTSPDRQTALQFTMTAEGPTYSLNFRGRPVLTRSQLGLALDGEAPTGGLKIAGSRILDHDETWRPVYGERSTIRDRYRELDIDLEALQVTFRAYDEGVAFRYTIPARSRPAKTIVSRELSEFRFPSNVTAWATYSAQGRYAEMTVDKIRSGCERPLVVRIGDDLYAAIGEAALVDFPRMKLGPRKGRPNTLTSELDGKANAALPLATPWRFVLTADSPGRLLENNNLLLNLNEPCAIADTSWIKPGKVIREMTLTTAGGKECVDFAVRYGLQYVEYDAGWYGPENSLLSDAGGVHLDPARSKGPLDLQEVIRYAKERGVGIILYVNHLAAERQMDQIFPLYEKWGVKGVKLGFVNVGPQPWTSWLHRAVRKAAEHHLMVDIHDEYRPTGYSRTYPNLLTQEGVSGDETRPSATQTLTVQFTRCLAGAADNTVCYNSQAVMQNLTHGFQLAKTVCLYSPWQFLFWYDKPTGVKDTPELEFYKQCPTVWDDTRVLHGRIGEYAVIARRRGEEWFIGFMNGKVARKLDTPLSFLDDRREYTASLYIDDASVESPTHVRVERRTVRRQDVLPLGAAANAGAAVWIRPREQEGPATE
jgi:alpha-glucosidase